MSYQHAAVGFHIEPGTVIWREVGITGGMLADCPVKLMI
jgi:hypothetical protein